MNDGVTSVEVIEDSPKGGFIRFPSPGLFQSTLRILIEAVSQVFWLPGADRQRYVCGPVGCSLSDLEAESGSRSRSARHWQPR